MLGRVDVDAVPRGIALVSDADGRPEQAWVLNAVENTVSLVDVANEKAPYLSAELFCMIRRSAAEAWSQSVRNG